MRHAALFFAALLPLSALALPGNYSVVTEGVLHRSAQPSKKDLEDLKKRGIKTIISLRMSNIKEKEPETEKAGLGFINIPIKDRGVPTAVQVYMFIGAVKVAENQPALVHCQKGRGRTGIMVALYRVIAEGWALDKALAEGARYGLSSNKQRKFVQDIASMHMQGTSTASNRLASPCDPKTQPRPHYGPRGGKCVPSCGGLGGTRASNRACERDGKVSAGVAYDADYCCK